MRRISLKKLSQLGGRVPSSSITGKKKGIRKKKRSASEFARIYGSKERVGFVKSLPCAACGVVGYSENAHVENGGMGRKADYTKIVPLCGKHPHPRFDVLTAGCHALSHALPNTFRARYPDFDPEKAAAETQSRWLAYQSGGQPK